LVPFKTLKPLLTKRSAEPWWDHSLKGDWDSFKDFCWKGHSLKDKGHSLKGLKSKGHFLSKGFKVLNGTKAKSYIHKGLNKR
jgi:hypothetical protein